MFDTGKPLLPAEQVNLHMLEIAVDPFQHREVSRPAAQHGLPFQELLEDIAGRSRDADLVYVHDRVLGDTE